MGSQYFFSKKTKYFVNKKDKKPVSDFEGDFFYQEEQQDENSATPESSNEFLGKYLSSKKINIFFFAIIVLFVALIGKAYYLQVHKVEYYRNLAEGNRIRQVAVPASRGIIYDKNLMPLVNHYPIFDISLIIADLPFNEVEKDNVLEQISQIAQVDKEALYDKIDEYPVYFTEPVIIKENIEYEQALLLKIKSSHVPGLQIETRNKREYQNHQAFGHILGYTGRINKEEYEDNPDYLLNDYIGKTGLEAYYEEKLRGTYGSKKVEVDARGNEKKVLSVTQPEKGQNLVLTIDVTLQQKVKEFLTAGLEKYNKNSGVAVLLDPRNGDILALVSLPDYDINLFAKGISQEEYTKLLENENNPLYDRSIKGTYPPGSTIKPVIGVGALDSGIITDNTSIFSSGGIWVAERWFFPDWNLAGHGRTNIYRAIAKSVNTFFYYIGGGYEDFTGLGLEGILKYYKLAGMGKRTGIDLNGEASGFLPSEEWKQEVKNEEWYIGDTYHISIGQGDVLVTPLQVANFTSIFANEGIIYQPHLVKMLTDPGSDLQHPVDPQIIDSDFFKPENVEIIKNAMRQTVVSGSAQSMNYLPVQIAGKTGTAQWHPDKDPHAWFTGFAPFEQPELVITILDFPRSSSMSFGTSSRLL